MLEDEVQQLLAEDCSFRLPEDQSLADSFVDKEEIELLSDLPVITQFRLLKLFEMLTKLGLILKGCTVNSLQLRILRITLVKGTRHAHDLERFAVPRAGNMRPRAKVPEITVLINRDLFVFRNLFEQINLEGALDVAISKRRQTPFLC